MIHVTTGNYLDVVLDWKDGRKVIKGLMPWNSEGKIIPLPEPQGLVDVLQDAIKECKEER